MNEEFKEIRREVRMELDHAWKDLLLSFNEEDFFVRLAQTQKRLTELQNQLHELLLTL